MKLDYLLASQNLRPIAVPWKTHLSFAYDLEILVNKFYKQIIVRDMLTSVEFFPVMLVWAACILFAQMRAA